MFKITIVCLGKFKENAFLELEKEYLKRLSVFSKFKIIEIKEVAYRDETEIASVKKREAELIKKALPKDSIVVLLDPKGTERGSEEFALFVDRLGGIGRDITFVLGSGIGLDESLKSVANHLVSLSKLTFSHNFARVLLEEQLYRAFTIIKGKSYHK